MLYLHNTMHVPLILQQVKTHWAWFEGYDSVVNFGTENVETHFWNEHCWVLIYMQNNHTVPLVLQQGNSWAWFEGNVCIVKHGRASLKMITPKRPSLPGSFQNRWHGVWGTWQASYSPLYSMCSDYATDLCVAFFLSFFSKLVGYSCAKYWYTSSCPATGEAMGMICRERRICKTWHCIIWMISNSM